MQDQKKYLKAALERIKKVARDKSAERLARKAAGKAAPKEQAAPKVEESDPAEELEEALSAESSAETEEEEPVDVMKKTTLVALPVRKNGASSVENTQEPPKRKPGRPRKVI